MGKPGIVWCDLVVLAYGDDTPPARVHWMVNRVLVYGIDLKARAIHIAIADRSRHPYSVSLDCFARARARVGRLRHRMLTSGAPDAARISLAVDAGNRDCIVIFTCEPGLRQVGAKFRTAASRWSAFSEVLLLPETAPSYDLYVFTGAAQTRAERLAIDARLAELKRTGSETIPQSEHEAHGLWLQMVENIHQILTVGRDAFDFLIEEV